MTTPARTTRHELKIDPEPFAAVRSGAKRYEVRRADRDFRIGDLLILREHFQHNGLYSGGECTATITYITPGGVYGLPKDLCVLGIGEPVYGFVCPF